jgi:hypothetical protein
MTTAIIIINVVLAAAVGITVVGLLAWSIVGGRSLRAAAARCHRPLLALGVVAGLAIVASPAVAGGTGAISGTVTNNAAAPAPLANICVQAQNPGTGATVAWTTTNASGQYTITGVPTGSYKVDFYDCGSAGYLTQYYNNQPSFAAGASVSVTAPATTSGINAKMVQGGKIKGTVTNNAAAPVALANICVEAQNSAGTRLAPTAKTNASGQYTLGPLPTKSYKVEFYDCSGVGYVTQYYNNEPSLATGNLAAVTAPATTSGINAKMALGGKIKGTVTNNAAAPVPLGNMCVAAFPPSGYSAVAFAKTNASGAYALLGLPTGSYKVEFYDCNGTNYIYQYYNNQTTLGSAKLVSVTAPNATSGINAKLVLGGKISGTVTNNAASPSPLANICVEVYTPGGSLVMSSSTVANGQYTIASVAPGSYKVEFIDCKNAAYVTQYFNNKASLATANSVSVTGAVTTTGISVKLVHV